MYICNEHYMSILHMALIMAMEQLYETANPLNEMFF